MPELDIVIPLYRTETNLSALLQRLDEWVMASGRTVCVIFVDDGSPDNTFPVLLEMLKAVKFQYKALRLATNYGQMAATACGLSYADAPLVATMDDDLQHDPFELDKMIAHLESTNSDLVYGTFKQRQHPFFRTAGSRFLKLLLLEKNRDYTQATSFRIMKLGTVGIFKKLSAPVKYIEQYFLHYAARKESCEVNHGRSTKARSNYSPFKLLRMSTEFIFFHSSLPLQFITRFGVLMSVVFFGLGIYYIVQRFVNEVQLGFTSIVVAIFFSTGLIMLSLGIIGEYIRRIWLSQNSLDRVIVAEVLE